MAKKFWIDAMVANLLGERLIPMLEDLFENGFVGVAADNAIDVNAFLANPDWVKNQIEDGRLVIDKSARKHDCSWGLCGGGVQHLTRRVPNPFFVADTSGSMHM